MPTSSDLGSGIRFPSGIFGGSPGRGGGIGRLVVLAAALLTLVFVSSKLFTYINPGHVGIVIHRMGGGVDNRPMMPGLHFRNPMLTAIEEYPTYMQTLLLTRAPETGSGSNDEINVNSIEGQPVSLDVSMSFELNPDRVPALYQTFRADIGTIQHTYVKQAIRQALQEVVGSEETAAIIGPKKAQVVAHTERLIAERLAPYGIEVKQFTINELRAPTSVIDAINAKNVMQQQALTAQNELQKKMFQAQGDSIAAAGRAKAITAEAEAQSRANTLLSQSITNTLVQYEMAKRWDGKMPTVTGGAMPMIQMPGTN